MSFENRSRKTEKEVNGSNKLDSSSNINSSVDKEWVKKTILDLLKTDEEFRYAVAGYIGYETVINELKSLRADFNKLYEKSLEYSKRLDAIENTLADHAKRLEVIEKTLAEHSKILDEHTKILIDHSKRLEAIERTLVDHTKTLIEHSKRLEAIEKTLIEHTRILIEHNKRLETIENTLVNYAKILEKHSMILEEHSVILEKHSRLLEEHIMVLRDLRTRVDKIDLELGALRETLFCDLVVRDLKVEIESSGDKLLSYERNVIMDNLEVDLLIITEKRVFVVEVKTKPRVEDVYELARKVDVVRNKYRDKEVVGILAGTWIGDDVVETALSRGMRIIKK